MRRLFGKKETPASKKAKENVKTCQKALDIVQKSNSIGDTEIKKLARTLTRVNPDINEVWVRKIVGMAKMGYLSHVNKRISAGQKPSDESKFVKDAVEGQLRRIWALWDRTARQLSSS